MVDLPPIKAGPYALVAAILECPSAEVTDETTIKTHPKWDSFAHLDIMMALSERFGVEINEDSVTRYAAMSEIVALHTANAHKP
ncbi:MAG: acyl carrier protein [Proteobacteria bacterium]|nr:acyl carrier protein [Pseudomonadota bacterium]